MLRSSHGHYHIQHFYTAQSFIETTDGEKRYGSPLDLASWTCFHTFHEVGTASHAIRAITASCKVEGIKKKGLGLKS